MPNYEGLERRLQRLEEKRSSSRLSWRTNSGRLVSFTIVPELLGARFELFEAMGAALVGDPLSPPGNALEALLDAPEEALSRLSERLEWIGSIPAQWDFVCNPPPDDDEGSSSADEVLARFP